jgi:hypothetical protein
MRDKSQILLEEAYSLIQEAAKPCPCLQKNGKCLKKGCKCPKCLARKKKTVKEDWDPRWETGDEETPEASEVEQKDSKEDLLSDPIIQQGMAILHQYQHGDISNLEAAKLFQDLYKSSKKPCDCQ